MSSRLIWRPAADYHEIVEDDLQLKRALQARFGFPLRVRLDHGYHAEFISGLLCAGVPGAQELMDAMIRHESIVIEEQS